MVSKTVNAFTLIAAISLGAASIIAPADVEGSEVIIQPSILLNEEYNDNVFLTSAPQYDDFITRVAPSLSVEYLAPKWDWKLNYTYDYRYYARKAIDNDSTNTLNLSNTNRIASDFLFLVVQDQYSRVSLDVTRDYTQQSNFVNQSDRNLFIVNPYLLLQPLSLMTVTTGYIFMNTWYKDPLATDRRDHIGYADVRQDLSPRSAVIAGVKHTLDINDVEGYTQDDLYLGMSHEYAEKAMITFKAGRSWFDFESSGRVSQVFWDAILTQRFPTFTILYETELRYAPDPLLNLQKEDRYFVTVKKDDDRSSMFISSGIVEYRNAENNQLQNTSYQMSGSISHNMTTKSKLTLDLWVERLKYNQMGQSVDTYYTGLLYEYAVRHDITLALNYRYTNVYSQVNALGTYDNNRFSVELRKLFY
jgi:hypothetical protein